VRVEHEGRSIEVDTGFIVYNERNYPLFSRLLDRLGVESRPAPMSFAVRDERTGLEYGGASVNGLFAQRGNLLSPRFLGMVRDILRFYEHAAEAIEREPSDITLGTFVERHGYGHAFYEQFLAPMGAAIWSSPVGAMRDFPARFFVRFFENHGMLTLTDRPQWRTITGGSWRYVARIVGALGARVRGGVRVASVRRGADHASVAWRDADGGVGEDRFDHVVLACHSDEALALLRDASPAEREILGAIPYCASDAVLHADAGVLPRLRRAWAAWNYTIPRPSAGSGGQERVYVTYNMSVLQSLGTRVPLFVTLNQTDAIDPSRVLMRRTYHHPVFTIEGLRAQRRYHEIGGGRTHFGGAYWYNGFHEDGVRSAARIAADLGVSFAQVLGRVGVGAT
jgi:predicted NAD/FAD-binding protein